MQKLTKLTYMIAAVIISNIVYAISNLKSVAFAAHLGMWGSNVRGAASVYAHATPNNVGITGCYVQAQDTFYDPSGTWVYDSDCPYNP